MKQIALSIVFMLTSVSLMSQSIEGKIVDCKTKNKIPNAKIKIGTQVFISDDKGGFKLENISDNSLNISVSKDGYLEKKIKIDAQKSKKIDIEICKDETIEIEEVVVTATRTPKTLKNVPITVKVITSEDVKKSQSVNFQSFLENELAGINFTNNGGMPNINMMGFGGKYVLFLVNGERLAGETFDNIDYDRIDIDNIERIEIIRGASSSLYGSNALGGVINIITKDIKKPIEINAGYLYESSVDHKYNLTVGTKRKWGTIGISSFYKHREPYILKDTQPLDLIFDNGTIEQSEMSEVYIAGFTNYGISPKIKLNIIKDKLNLELNPTYYFSERNSGTPTSKKSRDHYYNYTAGGKINYSFDKDKKISFSGAYDKYDKYNYYRIVKEKQKNYDNTIWRIGTQYNQTFAGKHSLVAGGEVLSEELLSFRFNNKGTEAREDSKIYTLFAQQDWAINDNLTLVTGIRMDYHSLFKNHITYRLSGMYKIDKFTFRGGYSTGFRSPTLKELYTNWFHPWGGGFQIMGNKNLKPESSNNVNFSMDYDLGRFNFTAMSQISMVRDKIAMVWSDAKDEVKYVNFDGNTHIIGSEISAMYRFLKGFRLRGSYTYYNIEQRQSEERPHTITLKAEYQPKAGKKYIPNVILSGKYLSPSKLYSTLNDEKYYTRYEGYFMWRLQTSMLLPYGFSLNMGINNIFDYKSKFNSFYSSTSPGRTYFVGLRWGLDK